jgi:tRNA (guanine-N7-)-methyltransferase
MRGISLADTAHAFSTGDAPLRQISMTEHNSSDGGSKPHFYDPTERRIRSFVTRAGRVSTAQGRALTELGPTYMIPYDKAPLDLAQAFGRTAPTIFEIGFGMGETTATIAAGMPDKNFIGVEVHTPGVGSLLKLIGEEKLNNVRIIQHDAYEVLTHMIAPASLAGVHVFFPDPCTRRATTSAG